MKLSELVECIDKSERNEADWGPLVEELGFCWADQQEPRIKAYWLASHYCTDTRVGIILYFFDDIIICMSVQKGRKCHTEFEWVSQAIYEEVKSYVGSCLPEEDKLNIDILDLEGEVHSSYHIEYASQIIRKDIMYLGKPVTAVGEPNDYNFHQIIIEDENGRTEVDIRDTITPWNIKEVV